MRAGGQELPSYDPRQTGVSGQSYHIHGLVYSQLLRRPFNKNALASPLVCELCEKWETPDGGKTYIFQIRQGIKWHDKAPLNGRALTAEDIRWVLTDGEGFDSKNPKFVKQLNDLTRFYGAKVQATGPSTLTITLKEASADFLTTMANPNITYPAREAVEASKSSTNPEGLIGLGLTDSKLAIGTGPFMLKEYTKGVGGTLVRNPNYFLTDQVLKNGNKLPYLDEVQFLFLLDHRTRTAAMLAGQLDESGIYLDDTDVEQLKAAGQFEFDEAPSGFAPWFEINPEKAPFSDVRVRRALHLATNRQDLVKVSNMKGSTVQAWIPSAWAPYGLPSEDVLKRPGYRADKTQDKAEARRLLSEAGQSNLAFTIIAQQGGLDVEHAMVWQQQLKDIGVTAKVEPIDRAAFLKQQFDGNYEVSSSPQLCAGPDPGDCLFNFVAGEAKARHRWTSPQMENLIQAASRSMDTTERVKVIRQAIELLDENAAAVSLYRAPWYRSWRKGFHNVTAEPQASGLIHWVDHVWKDK
ncbi:MAG: ABC transporter substrate-binding protein [Dehalococcoidia bacterium]|nr:ABC transporter substrate-binding protein [Dehalococcoidia bacterium]